MNTQTRTTTFLGVALAVGIVGFWLGREQVEAGINRSWAGTMAALKAQMEQLREQNRQLLRERDDATRRFESMRKANETRENTAKTPASAASLSSSVRTIHRSDIIRDHPEYDALTRKDIRRSLYLLHGDLQSALGLSPEKAALLAELLVERQVWADSLAQTGVNPDALRRVNETGKQITSIVGVDGEAKLTVVCDLDAFRQEVATNYQADFEMAGMALTTDQSN